MAQIIEKIVRSKYPPEDTTRVLWLDIEDNSLKVFTSNGWQEIMKSFIQRITDLEIALNEISYVEGYDYGYGYEYGVSYIGEI